MINLILGGERGLNSTSVEGWHTFQILRIVIPAAKSCPNLFSALLKPAEKVVRLSFDAADLTVFLALVSLLYAAISEINRE